MRFIGLCVSVMLLSACGNSERVKVGLSTRVGSARGAQAVAAKSAQQLEPAAGITLERVRLSVRELELEYEGDDRDDGRDDDDDQWDLPDDDEQRLGPILIDLSADDLNGRIVPVGDLRVAPGVFDEIEFDIGKLTVAQAGQDAALRELAELGASMVIDGHIDGQPFSFVTSVRMEQEREARFEVKDGQAPNITLNIDPTGWFIDGNGQRLDPRDASARATIEDNLRRSIDAFDDDDLDGDEDDDDRDDD